jgi:SP family arabinose:H+ symporter-like MFS transporter
MSIKAKTNVSYVLFLGATASLGGLLFGFDIAIITGAGPFLRDYFHLTDLSLGWAFSSLLFGCVLGSAMAGRLTDTFGRRGILLWVALLFLLTSVGTGLAPSFAWFIIARFLGGLAVGGASILAPMYVSEVSPAAMRGRMGTLYQLSIVIGILISYIINYQLHDIGEWNWRWMFISGALPSLAFFLLLLPAPETPRYLFKVGREKEAYTILERIDGHDSAVAELEQIRASLTEKIGFMREVMKPGLRRALLVGFVLAILIHFSGINTVIDYAPSILKSAGWKIDAALFSTFVIGTANLLFTLVSFWVIDRYGRKIVYIVGSLGMTAVLVTMATLAAVGRFQGGLVLGLLLAYVAFFASCIGPVFWTLVPEIFPNRVRGVAMSVPVLTQWVANAVMVLFFPAAFNQIGKAPTIAFLAVMALAQAIFTWKMVPETKGRSLEEIEALWQPGNIE